jgi:hypothetical protein
MVASKNKGWWLAVVAGALACGTGCETGRPGGADASEAGTGMDAGADAMAEAGGEDAGAMGDAVDAAPDAEPDAGPAVTCMPLATDYTPRVMMSATDMWPACVSDMGTYARFNTSTSSIARVAAFERMNLDPMNGRAMGFFDPRRDPTPDEFTAARMIYLEPEGLDSRVSRRSDEHYPRPSTGDCTMDAVRTAFPDYCVGPARLLPIINDSFRDGQLGTTGTPQRVLAARIEAALLWFLYLSPYKESLTCTTNTGDCDSAWAYYTGGAARGDAMQLGLARLVSGLDRATHDRVWDGILAVRCWRDLDRATPATDTATRDRARAQLDRALTRGIVLVLESRLRAMAAASGAEQQAHFAFVKVVGPLLDRAVRAQDPAAADALRTSFAATSPAGIDVPTVIATLDRVLPCP